MAPETLYLLLARIQNELLTLYIVTLPAVTCSVTSCGATPYITNGDFELGAIEPLDTSSTGCLMEDGVETIDVHGGNYAE